MHCATELNPRGSLGNYSNAVTDCRRISFSAITDHRPILTLEADCETKLGWAEKSPECIRVGD